MPLLAHRLRLAWACLVFTLSLAWLLLTLPLWLAWQVALAWALSDGAAPRPCCLEEEPCRCQRWR